MGRNMGKNKGKHPKNYFLPSLSTSNHATSDVSTRGKLIHSLGPVTCMVHVWEVGTSF